MRTSFVVDSEVVYSFCEYYRDLKGTGNFTPAEACCSCYGWARGVAVQFLFWETNDGAAASQEAIGVTLFVVMVVMFAVALVTFIVAEREAVKADGIVNAIVKKASAFRPMHPLVK